MIRNIGFAVVSMSVLVAEAKEPVDYVNTGIGSVSHMLVPTFRTVQRPNAMYRFNGPAGQFTESEVRACHLFVPGHRDPGVFPFYPLGASTAAMDSAAIPKWRGTWDHERATPYSYDIHFDAEGVRMSVAPGEKSALFAFAFEKPGRHALVFSTRDRERGKIGVSGNVLTGMDVFSNRRGELQAEVFLRGAFDTKPLKVVQLSRDVIVSFPETPCTVHFRMAVSYVSSNQAARTLVAEMPDFDLARVSEAARNRWNATLGQIEVEGGTDAEKSVFYTALWRTYERMVNVTEDGHYRGFDHAVHASDGVDYYVDDWSWDTYRAAHPLMTILRPHAEGEKLQSYVRMGEQNKEGWMPVFPGISGDRHSMVNRHPSVMMLDAWRKGIRNFDAQKAFAIIDHTEETESLVPWYRGPLTELDRFYKEHGYYPGLHTNEQEWVKGVDTRWERRQCVSLTLGAAFDAWAIAEFGRELGIDSARLAKYDSRARAYAQLWNPKTQFFHPKDAAGKFIEPFDYLLCGGYGARNYFTENNAWTYIWDVQHDLPGLVRLFGGPDQMAAKLDRMLNVSVGERWRFTSQMPDGCTGLMGVFTMANEPSFHIPYLYNYCGQPEKTQKFVRKTLEAWFRNDRMGMCGDEDGGGMSAYAVFSMLGFYPVTPGRPEYQWGSPVFRKVTIHLENGKDFVLAAPAASREAKYIHAIRINGKPTPGACTPLRHSDIVAGASVVVDMSERPLATTPHRADLAAYVDAFTGTSATGHTHPAAAYPFGMLQAGPDTGMANWAYCSGYQYRDESVLGYSQNHLSGTGCPDYGDVQILPFSGKVRELPMRSAIDKSTEFASPGYYSVDQIGDGVKVEIAAAKKAAIYRFAWKDGKSAKVLVNLPFGACCDTWAKCRTSDASVANEGDRTLTGEYYREGWICKRKVAFRIEFDRAWTRLERLPELVPGEAPRYVAEFALSRGETLMMKVALSNASKTAAARNLATIPDWDLDGVRAATRAEWNRLFALSTCEGSDAQKANWYTALYHLYLQPNDWADEGDAPNYTTLSLWDTFRAAQPWYTVVTPELVEPVIGSMLKLWKSVGRLPVMSYGAKNVDCMIGNHSVPVIADAYLKGFRAFDVEEAVVAITNTLTVTHPGKPKENWDQYLKYGYFPLDLNKGEGASRTLECAYDDWCAAQLFAALGKRDLAAEYLRRSANWKHIFDASIGFARGKDTQGKWREPFSPFALAHENDWPSDFTEGNSWQYTWHVMQDPEGLIAALGGKAKAAAKLDELFHQSSKVEGQGFVSDVSGLIGQYAHGNEPSHHVIYLFQHVGRPELAAKYIREVFDTQYHTGPEGLCGNDDCGQMSAWYLFSAMGFYPFNPCGGEFVIGAPQVGKATLNLRGGKTFTVIAHGLSKENKFVKAVRLNGKPLAGFVIRYADIMAGGTLEFEMKK